MAKIQAIYETKGRAKEFCDHALNLYRGCAHHCVYCYGPDVTHNPDFFKEITPRIRFPFIVKSAREWTDRLAGQPVLLCFSCDPYQPLEEEAMLTRSAIMALNREGIPVHILTKAGKLPRRDFDILAQFPGNAFATTLTFTDDLDRLEWEPGAGTIADRIENLMRARSMGIETWASLEPVIIPEQSLEILKSVHPFVNHFKLGKLNYHPRSEEINWRDYAHSAVDYLISIGKPAFVKKDLVKHFSWEGSQGRWIGT